MKLLNGTNDIYSIESALDVKKLSSKFYLKTTVRGREKWSDLEAGKTESIFWALPGCNSIWDAKEMANEILDELYETLPDSGNELIEFEVGIV